MSTLHLMSGSGWMFFLKRISRRCKAERKAISGGCPSFDCRA